MAVNTTILKEIPPQILSDLSFIITILKAAGILLLIYIVYLIVSFIMNSRNYKRIKEINERVETIDGKLDKLLKMNEKEKK
jgi:hypothetical protein